MGMKFTNLSQIDAIAQRIESAPVPERKLTVAETLRRLTPALRKMRAAGHTADSICAALAGEGVVVSVRSVRQVLGKSSVRPSGKVDARKTPPAVQAEVHAQCSEK